MYSKRRTIGGKCGLMITQFLHHGSDSRQCPVMARLQHQNMAQIVQRRPDQPGKGEAVPLSSAMYYIFVCWGALIVVGLFFGIAARRLGVREDQDADAE